MKVQTPLTVVFFILLASCTTVSVVPTSTTEVVVTPSFTQTSVPSPSATPQPSATNTNVAYSSKPYPDSLFKVRLSSLVLTPNEIPPLDPNYLQLIEPKVQNSTSKIQDCGKDCVNVVWKSKKVEGVGEEQLSIRLIRMDTDLKAAESVVAAWEEFSQIESSTIFEEGDLIQANRDWLPNNSKVAIKAKEPNVEVMFVGSRGPVYLEFVYYFQASGDLVLNFGSIQNMVVLQIKKLEAAGYPK